MPVSAIDPQAVCFDSVCGKHALYTCIKQDLFARIVDHFFSTHKFKMTKVKMIMVKKNLRKQLKQETETWIFQPRFSQSPVYNISENHARKMHCSCVSHKTQKTTQIRRHTFPTCSALLSFQSKISNKVRHPVEKRYFP